MKLSSDLQGSNISKSWENYTKIRCFFHCPC